MTIDNKALQRTCRCAIKPQSALHTHRDVVMSFPSAFVKVDGSARVTTAQRGLGPAPSQLLDDRQRSWCTWYWPHIGQ